MKSGQSILLVYDEENKVWTLPGFSMEDGDGRNDRANVHDFIGRDLESRARVTVPAKVGPEYPVEEGAIALYVACAVGDQWGKLRVAPPFSQPRFVDLRSVQGLTLAGDPEFRIIQDALTVVQSESLYMHESMGGLEHPDIVVDPTRPHMLVQMRDGKPHCEWHRADIEREDGLMEVQS